MRTKPRALIALLSALVLLAGCGGSGDSGGDTNEPITIGVSLPLSGQFAQPGQQAKRGYEIWRDMVNADGGVVGRKVELKIMDDASNQDTVVADYTRLITQDKVDLLLGTFSSLLNYPASAVAEKNNMVFVEPAGGAPNMFTRGFTKLFFAQQATSDKQGEVFADWIESLPEAERPKTAAYPTLDDPFAKPVSDTLRKDLEKLGVETVYRTVYPAGTTNFQSVGAAVKGKKPDMIVNGAQFDDGVGLVRSLKQLDFSPKIMFQSSAPSEAVQYSDGVGEANTEGVFYSVSWNDRAPTPLNKEFVDEYAKRFDGALPAEDAADAFAAAQVLQAAVEGVKEIDQDKIGDWLHANEVQTILGKLSWDSAGRGKASYMLAQWQAGRPEIVAPDDVSTSKKIVNPKPDWQQ
ncbi:MAG: ABC transporter substrate-binding protein [Streptosporangiales bacterium]|nr:ABC transporter substrate-binding protein [Streptosporangiales bacterium]